jgi:hypothetical protein
LVALVISTAAARFSSLAACTGCSPICVVRNLWPVAILTAWLLPHHQQPQALPFPRQRQVRDPRQSLQQDRRR